jgi:hypothetical protein
VTAVTAIAAAFALPDEQGETAMASICTNEGWWDASLIDERNERALLSAFVAAIAVWATAFLLALV